MEYIVLIHTNTETTPSNHEWSAFINKAIESKLFKGGSAIGSSVSIGSKQTSLITNNIGGFMRFDSENKTDLLKLLESHPVVLHGGTIELCEMPKN